jgi:hypothetical protein
MMHKELAAGRWFELSLIEQLANIGSDVVRTIKWKNKENFDRSKKAFERTARAFEPYCRRPKK